MEPTGVLIISSDVRAKGIVTLGEPIVRVGPEQACTGGAAAVKVHGFVVETAVAPVGPAVSPLSLRSQERKV
jgi:hypothetical protein